MILSLSIYRKAAGIINKLFAAGKTVGVVMDICKENIKASELSPLNLAFIGDCIYEIMVRRMLVAKANRPVNDLHRESVKLVSAKAQTEAFGKIEPLLSEKELLVFKRGRNAKTGHVPKSASSGEYHCATGLEALFGYLYLENDFKRLEELFAVITE